MTDPAPGREPTGTDITGVLRRAGFGSHQFKVQDHGVVDGGQFVSVIALRNGVTLTGSDADGFALLGRYADIIEDAGYRAWVVNDTGVVAVAWDEGKHGPRPART